jgi:hypothetical protein
MVEKRTSHIHVDMINIAIALLDEFRIKLLRGWFWFKIMYYYA